MLVIGQCNSTVDTSCLCKWTVRALFLRILPCRVIYCFFIKTYHRSLVAFSNFVQVSYYLSNRHLVLRVFSVPGSLLEFTSSRGHTCYWFCFTTAKGKALHPITNKFALKRLNNKDLTTISSKKGQ